MVSRANPVGNRQELLSKLFLQPFESAIEPRCELIDREATARLDRSARRHRELA